MTASAAGYEPVRNPKDDWLDGYRFALRNLGQPGVLRDAARYREEAESGLRQEVVQDAERGDPGGAARNPSGLAPSAGLPMRDVQGAAPDETPRHWHLIVRHKHPDWHGHCSPGPIQRHPCERTHWHGPYRHRHTEDGW